MKDVIVCFNLCQLDFFWIFLFKTFISSSTKIFELKKFKLLVVHTHPYYYYYIHLILVQLCEGEGGIRESLEQILKGMGVVGGGDFILGEWCGGNLIITHSTGVVTNWSTPKIYKTIYHTQTYTHTRNKHILHTHKLYKHTHMKVNIYR